jgi:hypothetical protein
MCRKHFDSYKYNHQERSTEYSYDLVQAELQQQLLSC